MKPSAPRPDLLLQLMVMTEYGSSELRGEIRYLNTRDNPHRKSWHHDDAVLAPLFEHPDVPYDRYADLCVRASIDTSGINNGATYAWGYSYGRPVSVDLARAQSMAATLRRIDRQIAALQQRFGVPRDFGEYVAQSPCSPVTRTTSARYCWGSPNRTVTLPPSKARRATRERHGRTRR